MSVVVEPYNSQWPSHFQTIKSELEHHLKGIKSFQVEHVGSTSVPGLAAKPIVDVDIIVPRANIQPTIDALVTKGDFKYLGELGIIDRHAVHSTNQQPARNIYVCVEGAFQTRNHLAIRDTLRTDEGLRKEYGRLKLDLAAQDTNIVDYIEAKGSLLQRILARSGCFNEEELASINAANKKGSKVSPTKTERLTLREFVLGDVQAYYELESIPEVVRYQDFEPRTFEEAERDVVRIVQGAARQRRTHVELVVLHENTFVGRVGTNIKFEGAEKQELEVPVANLWFSFMPKSQGKGFATEALEAFLQILAGSVGKDRQWKLEIECDPRNLGCRKLAERVGFVKVLEAENVYESKGEMVGSCVYQRDL